MISSGEREPRPWGFYPDSKNGESWRKQANHDLNHQSKKSPCYRKSIRFLFPFKLKITIFLSLLIPVHISSIPLSQSLLSETRKSDHFLDKRAANLQSLSNLDSNKESFENNKINIAITRNDNKNKSESESRKGAGSTRNKRADGGNWKPSFGQLVILAQEEAKCLQNFDGRTFLTPSFMTEELYSPILCSKSSNQFAQCEICRNLTARPRTKEECSSYCGTSSPSFCQEKCLSINKAVMNGALQADAAITKFRSGSSNESLGVQKEKDSNNGNHKLNPFNGAHIKIKSPIFSQIPQVFCEGVLEDHSTTGTGFRQVSTEVEGGGRWEAETGTEITNHFIVLKWILEKRNEAQEAGESSGESNSQEVVTQTRDNITSPIVFVIEKYSASLGRWEALGKTPFNLQQINVTFLSDTYKWRVTAVGPNAILDQVTSVDYKTLNGYVKPGPPRRIYVVKTVPDTGNSSIVKVLIGWDPPKENACSYKLVLETHEGAEKPIRIKEPLGVHQHWFNLLAGTQYSILITTRDPSWDQHSESNLKRLDFQTPTCLDSHNFRFDKCAPPPPRGIESKILENSGDSKTVRVRLGWKPPQNTSAQNPILYYNVTITQLSYKNAGGGSGGGVTGLMSSSDFGTTSGTLKGLNLNGSFPLDFSGSAFSNFLQPSRPSNSSLKSNSTTVSGNTTHLQIPSLESNAEYQVSVHAVSIRGSSTPAQHLLVTKIVKVAPEIAFPLSNWLYLAIPVSAMMILLLACNMGRVYLQKRQVKIARNQYFQSMEEHDASADWSIVPLTDETYTWKLFDDNFPKEKWQIGSESLIMGEVIGQGAFGVVRRAKIPRRKLQSSTLKYLDKTLNGALEGSDRTGDSDLETVAVKMLKVSATRDDREQLVKEIMTMQSLGFHPQIVGLIGASTKGRSLSLVLEYCSGGDLLTFIRKVRAKYWPTLGLAEAKKNSNSTSSTSRTFVGSTGTNQIKNNNSSDCNNESEDNSPINYADLDHFSEYSSSPRSEHLSETQPLSPKNPPCHSPTGKSHQSQNEDEDDDEDDFRPIDEKDVLSYARQIAMGMEYLEKNRIVHRDLACRNCLLMGDHRQVKLSDFGLSRDIYTWNVYHQKSNGKLPIKWMAIESIFTHVFTTKSDVWSYGILLWELVTLGGTPYPGLGNTELFHLLKSGYRMERPDNCSEELFALMKKCWRTSPAARPNFTELRNYVQNMMEAAEPNLYLSLMADIPSDYFRLGSRTDLLQMNDTTDGGSLDLFTGSSASNMNLNRSSNSKKYAGYHNTHTTYQTPIHKREGISSPPTSTSSGGPSSEPQGGGGVSESPKCTGQVKGYSRTNSASSSSTSNSNGKSSTNSSVKFTLDSVPERGSKCNQGPLPRASCGESSESGICSQVPSPMIPDLAEGESTKVKKVTGDRDLGPPTPDRPGGKGDLSDQDRTKGLKKSQSSAGLSISSSCLLPRSPTSPSGLGKSTSPISLQFSYPFKQVNSMTIIENKSYGLTDD